MPQIHLGTNTKKHIIPKLKIVPGHLIPSQVVSKHKDKYKYKYIMQKAPAQVVQIQQAQTQIQIHHAHISHFLHKQKLIIPKLRIVPGHLIPSQVVSKHKDNVGTPWKVFTQRQS